MSQQTYFIHPFHLKKKHDKTCSAEQRILPLNADQHARSSPTGTGGIVDTRQHLLSQGVAIQARPDQLDWQPPWWSVVGFQGW